MKLLKRNGNTSAVVPATESPFEDVWSRFFRSPMNLASHLPEVFNQRTGPPLNVSEDENDYCVSLEAPGMNEDDFDIQIMGRQVIISGERTWEDEEKTKDHHRVESQYGSFERSVMLPDDCKVDADSIKAKYKRGMLSIEIPKLEPTPVRKVKVTSN